MKEKASRFVYWTPRIISILFIIYQFTFSFDVFGRGLGFWETISELIMHNTPTILLSILLLISWRYEIIGGIAFIIAGLFYIMIFSIDPQLIIFVGAEFIAGIMFFMNWYKKIEIKQPKTKRSS